jgi:hypothetical protein
MMPRNLDSIFRFARRSAVTAKRLWLPAAVCVVLVGLRPWFGIAQQTNPSDGSKPAPQAKPAAEDFPPEDDTEQLPTVAELPLPTFEQLIQGPAYDWIVLTNEKCFPVEPLIVRPGAIDAINAQVKAALRKPGGLSESEEAKRKRLALYYLPVTLTRGEEREYKLHSRFIREIIYFEDQMLQRVDRLLDEKEVRKAYELLVALEARDPKWPGIPPRRERLVATEAAMLADRGELEQALMLLEELYDKNPAYSGLEFQMGTVVDRLVERALAADDPRQARFFLKRLARRIPGQCDCAAKFRAVRPGGRVAQSGAGRRTGSAVGQSTRRGGRRRASLARRARIAGHPVPHRRAFSTIAGGSHRSPRRRFGRRGAASRRSPAQSTDAHGIVSAGSIRQRHDPV